MGKWECKYLEFTGFFGTTMYCMKNENKPEKIDNRIYEKYCKDKCEDCPTYNESSGSLCFLTTACCEVMGKEDDCFELQTLRLFRDEYMIDNGYINLVEEYYRIAPKIVEAINKQTDARKIWENLYYEYIKPCVNLAVKDTDECNEECLRLYKHMVLELKEKYF